jgi:hypothetical protein
MTENQEPSAGPSGGLRVRTMELVVAFLFFAGGALVVYDSHRLGSSWGSDGPEAGYFPFYIGLIICISAVVIFGQALFGRVSRSRAVFVEWQALRQVLSVLLPAIAYIGVIQILGIYVASAIYIAGFMLWLGKYHWIKSALLGIAVAAVAFITFEVWFQVPLYKGAYDLLSFLGY